MEQQLVENHMRLPPPVTASDAPAALQNLLHKHTPPLRQPRIYPAQPPQCESSVVHIPGSISQHQHHPPPPPPPPQQQQHPLHHHDYHQQQLPPLSQSPRALAADPAYPPPSYACLALYDHDHDPSTLSLPHAPSTELAPLQLNAQEHNANVLPSLASLTGPPSASSASNYISSTTRSETSYSPPPRARVWPSGNPYSAYYAASSGQSGDSPARLDIDSMSNGTRGPLSPENLAGRASSVSLDDPDVKIAAEALGDLKANFISSPRNIVSTMPPSPNHFGTPGPTEAEPLLSLVMTSGSVLAKPIETGVSAYATSKTIAPLRYIRAPLEQLEGVVGSGLHITGIEGGVRWFFRAMGSQHLASDSEHGESSHKRRRVNSSGWASISQRGPDVTIDNDAYGFTNAEIDRRLYMRTDESLPAYDDARSPAYTENATTDEKNDPSTSRPSSTTPTAWQSRLIMSTSGLSIAMSEESLRSLKFCLSWLRWANDRIGRYIRDLKHSLEQYDSQGPISLPPDHAMNDDPTKDRGQARRALTEHINTLRNNVLKILQDVIEKVSKHAGGALPDNARALVRRHLTSLPQRFMLATREFHNTGGSPAPSALADASTEEGKEKEVREGAHSVLVLATEGLEMMAQVSGVLDGTIVSAEEWCQRLGRKIRDEQAEEGRAQQEQEQIVPFAGVRIPEGDGDGDVKMN